MKARLIIVSVVVLLLLVSKSLWFNLEVAHASSFEPALHARGTAPGAPAASYALYLPIVVKEASAAECAPIASESYSTLSINGSPSDRPAEQHADLNLGLRGYTPTSATLALVNYNGPTDGNAPQFPALFADNRTPSFTSAYRVYNWNFAPPPNPGTRGTPITSPPVTLLGMGTATGEMIRVPNSGYNIGNGYQVLVLYAAPGRITLKYTREDNVISGYTVHIENVCIEPRLLALYNAQNSAGRRQLPALRGTQAFGRAVGSEVLGSIQDNGTWMDPRSRKDWWQGR